MYKIIGFILLIQLLSLIQSKAAVSSFVQSTTLSSFSEHQSKRNDVKKELGHKMNFRERAALFLGIKNDSENAKFNSVETNNKMLKIASVFSKISLVFLTLSSLSLLTLNIHALYLFLALTLIFMGLTLIVFTIGFISSFKS